jgi:hypothetical protein
MHGYVGSSSRVPHGSTAPFLSPSGGVQTYSYIEMNIQPAANIPWPTRRTSDRYSRYTFSNKYNTETANPGVNNSIITDGNYCTGASSITYNIEFLRVLYNKLVSFGFSSFVDFTKVSTQGFSGTAMEPIVSSVIMEKYQSTFQI